MARHVYGVFGITLASDFEFEVLEPPAEGLGKAPLEVIRDDSLQPPAERDCDPYFDIQPDRQLLHWEAVGTFLIESTDVVRIAPKPEVTDHLVSQAFLGIVMSLVLERRGILCLHASAVSVHGKAAIFLGDKGAGKSTTSGALLARGHAPITDDLVAVDGALEKPPTPIIWPGFASMKLWPDAVAALELSADEKDREIHPSVAKVQKRMAVPVVENSVSLGALCVLRRDASVEMPHAVQKPPHEALQLVLRYTFMARYGETRLGPAHLAHHMKRCGAVVSAAPVYDLMIPADLTRLGDLSAAIEDLLSAKS